MAKFDDHILQVTRNIDFLHQINTSGAFFDWQVTVCFYSALHIVNAHISKFGLQYRSHADVDHAINPYNTTSVMKIPEDVFISYNALQSLSRRARYLVSEKDNNLYSDQVFLIYEKHFAKAIRHLDIIICYFTSIYNDMKITTIKVNCSDIRNNPDLKAIVVN